jgi:hypothetical protein
VLARANSALLAITAASRVAVLPTIAVVTSYNALPVSQQCHELQRCRSRSNAAGAVAAPRVAVPLAIAATRCQPCRSNELQSVADLPQQRVATRCRPCRNGEQQRFAGLTAALRSSAATCHRWALLVWLPSNFHRTSVQLSSDVRPTSVLRLAYVIADVTYRRHYWRHHIVVLHPNVLRPLSCRLDILSSYVLPLDVMQSYVLRTMVVHLVDLCPAAYLIAFCRSTVLWLGRFRPYIVLEFWN